MNGKICITLNYRFPSFMPYYKLRCAVFVVEQNCPYQDIDGDDLTGDNRHILGWKNDELVAYARISEK